ncbi:unnamed protein product [Caenorhabditis brenneri]
MFSTTSNTVQQRETTVMAAEGKKLSFKRLFSRIFSKKQKSSTDNDLKVFQLEAQLAKSEADRQAQTAVSESLVAENQRIQKALEMAETKLQEAMSSFENEREEYLKIIEKQKYDQREIVHGLNCDKNELIRKLQTAHQITTELKLDAQAEQEHIQKVLKIEAQLCKDQKDFEEIRKKSQAAMRKQLKKESEKSGELFAWQSCEICLEPFGEEKERTPRIFGCGHTFCLECSKKFVEEDYVKCPLDRIGTQFKGDIEKVLPKNFSVLNMCI